MITGNQGKISSWQWHSYEIKILKTTLEFNKNKDKYLKLINYCCFFSKSHFIYLAKTNTQGKHALLLSSVSSLQLVENIIFSRGYDEFTHHAFFNRSRLYYTLLITFQQVNVYLNEPIETDELIKLGSQSFQRCAQDRNGKADSNFYFDSKNYVGHSEQKWKILCFDF